MGKATVTGGLSDEKELIYCGHPKSVHLGWPQYNRILPISDERLAKDVTPD